jgi:ribosomal protein S18 acetylase RimI-like enzyme
MGNAIRRAVKKDIKTLLEIENLCFTTDRLNRRNFLYLLSDKSRAVSLVYEEDERVGAYCTLLFNAGTSLARLYSIAVHPYFKGKNIGTILMTEIENTALENDCAAIRLEVKEGNTAALKLYERMGYRYIGNIPDYYEDHAMALRYEKFMEPPGKRDIVKVPYYEQTLDFTCGAAALLMAMASFDDTVEMNRIAEIEIWREATTIFMTSGHGGTDPYGLALSASKRGYDVSVYINTPDLFINSVRSKHKKEVMRLVQDEILKKLRSLPVQIHKKAIHAHELISAIDEGWIPIILISSYKIYGEKFPHWVVVTGHDEKHIYFHDSYVDYEKEKSPTDCINMFIVKRDFEHMTKYGKKAQRAVILIRKPAFSNSTK